MGPNSPSKDPRPAVFLTGEEGREEGRVIRKRRKWTSKENKIVMECYFLNEPKIRGYRKCILRLWLQKGMF